MRAFSQIELKHLKFKMINERGMTPAEAEQEIAYLVKMVKANSNTSSRQGEPNRKRGAGFLGYRRRQPPSTPKPARIKLNQRIKEKGLNSSSIIL